MELKKAAALVASVYGHPKVLACYAEGDKVSRNQTKHDIGHAFEVLALSLKLALIINTKSPGKIDAWTLQVVLPLAAFLHDIGRCMGIDDHDKLGAQWAIPFLRELRLEGDDEQLPAETISRVARIIACHRTHRYAKVTFDEPALDIVLIADKCVGDEERVRPGRARVLRVLTWLGLSWLPLRKGGVHDRANFAIKTAEVVEREDDLVLCIDLDKRVCQPKLIYELYGDRFHCCVIAARKLGYGFKLQFNGVVHIEHEGKEGDWRAA